METKGFFAMRMLFAASSLSEMASNMKREGMDEMANECKEFAKKMKTEADKILDEEHKAKKRKMNNV